MDNQTNLTNNFNNLNNLNNLNNNEQIDFDNKTPILEFEENNVKLKRSYATFF